MHHKTLGKHNNLENRKDVAQKFAFFRCMFNMNGSKSHHQSAHFFQFSQSFLKFRKTLSNHSIRNYCTTCMCDKVKVNHKF